MKKFLLLFFIITSSFSAQTICTATASGQWNGAIWSCPGGPGCGKIVVIPSGISVAVTAHADYYSSCAACPASPCTGTCPTQMLVQVSGTITFDTGGGKLSMPCCSAFHVMNPSGKMVPNGSGSSNELNICNVKVWKASDGTKGGGTCFPSPCNSYLPVEFLAFTGNLEVKVVFLKWKTATELNNAYYDVEKSVDGINFTKITSVRSKALNGSNVGLLSYEAVDYDLKHPLYYYRLKQVDLDGSYKYTNSISVKIYSPEFTIYPNPNTGEFSIDVPTALTNQKLEVKIYDQLAKSIFDSAFHLANDNITGAKLDITPAKPLAKGVYICAITYNGEEYRLKLVVN